MRRKDLDCKFFKIALDDNAKQTSWGWKKTTEIVDQSLSILESFLFSKETILNKSQHPLIELDIHFCGDARMKRLNTDYRGKDKTTDVLSFPVFESLRIESEEQLFPGPLHIGDIFISRDVAIKQAFEFDLSVEQEMIHLIVHGFLHLLGWDHEVSEFEEVIMQGHEKKILNKIKRKRAK